MPSPLAIAPRQEARPGPDRAASEAALDRLRADAIRTPSMDAVEAAGSGHPGAAMALAPAVRTLRSRVLRHASQTPPGPTGTGSCPRRATPRCCPARRCTSRTCAGPMGRRP